jgi:hypothetical protein
MLEKIIISNEDEFDTKNCIIFLSIENIFVSNSTFMNKFVNESRFFKTI